jgi:nitroreductase
MTATIEKTSQVMSVQDAIESRRSIRDYETAPIPEADLREILRLALLAPSSSNVQPWRFVVVTNPGMRDRILEAGNNQRQFKTAPVVIAVIADGEDMLKSIPETAHPNMQNDPPALERYIKGTTERLSKMSVADRATWAAEQTVYAVSYLSLAAQSLGYNTSIMGGFDQGKVKALLEVPDAAKVVVLITLGRGKEAGFSHHRHPLERVTRWVK